MAEFKEVMKQRDRMCKAILDSNDGRSIDCRCPLFSSKHDCRVYCVQHPQESEEIIMKWAEENPIKTNADKFKEVFGVDVSKDSGGCVGIECPPNKLCSVCDCLGFWDKEYTYKEQSNEHM